MTRIEYHDNGGACWNSSCRLGPLAMADAQWMAYEVNESVMRAVPMHKECADQPWPMGEAPKPDALSTMYQPPPGISMRYIKDWEIQ